MKETEKKVDKLCTLKDKLVCYLEGSIENRSVGENGSIVDMVKDLAKAEKACWEACYYKKLLEKMEEEKENPERYGYDNWRYSSGRFAPKGRGQRAGYIPLDPEPRMWDGMDRFPEQGRFGYDSPNPSMGMKDTSSYGRYRDARRHYTETGKPADKDEMSSHAKTYMAEAMSTFRDIWKDADPEMKTKMKGEIGALAKELGI